MSIGRRYGGRREEFMLEGAKPTGDILFGPSPSPLLAALNAAGVAAPTTFVPWKSRAELRELLQERHEVERPPALVLFDARRENGELAAMLDEVHLGSPLTVRAAVFEGSPSPHAIDAFDTESLDRLVRVDTTPERLALDLRLMLDRFGRLRRLEEAIRGRVGRHIFVTGASGFVGLRLIRELLRCTDAHITALVRSKGSIRFDERLPFTRHGQRLTFVEGEVTEPNLGLRPEVVAGLESTIDEVWHLAAVTDFSKDVREMVMQANVGGTREVLAFAAGLNGLKSFNHVSTAYVAGVREHPARVTESLADPPEEYHNPYEESKFLAERLVAESGLPYMMFRPSVIFGESFSGRSDGKTVYGVAEVFRVAKLLADRQRNGHGSRETVFRVRSRAEGSLNLVPVDWVVDEMLRIRAATEPDGSIYHITHDSPVSIKALHDVLMPLCGIDRCIIDPEATPSDLNSVEKFIYRRLGAFRPYIMERDPIFDRSNVVRAIGSEAQPPMSSEAVRYALEAFFARTRDGAGSPAGTSKPVKAAGAS